jgi:hypothetical protein
MTRGRAARFLGIVVAAALVIGCGQSAPNRDGWWDSGVHEVDGYWVTAEYPCAPEDDVCRVATETATDVLRQLYPAARITRAVMAGYPVQRGQTAKEFTIILGGLQRPYFVILDLADGTRRTIGLNCGPDFDPDGNMRIVCAESAMETWRVNPS